MSTPRSVRWIPWLLGLAALTLVVLAVLRVSEERAFLSLLEQARPQWLLWAVGLQAATYVAQAQIWQVVLRRAGSTLAFAAAYRLSLAKLFVDQALPTMGVSGAALVASSLEQQGRPRSAVMAAVAVDASTFYIAYAVNLALALAILVAAGHASALVVVAAVLFFVFGTAVATAVLSLSGHGNGRTPGRLLRIPGIKHAIALLREADPRIARDPRVLLQATALQMSIALIDAATVWALIRSLGASADPGAVFASFMLASLLRTFGFMPGGLGRSARRRRGSGARRPVGDAAVPRTELLAADASGARRCPSP